MEKIITYLITANLLSKFPNSEFLNGRQTCLERNEKWIVKEMIKFYDMF